MVERSLDEQAAAKQLDLHEPIAKLVGSIEGLTLIDLPRSLEPFGSVGEISATYGFLAAAAKQGPPRADEAGCRRFRREMLASLGPHDVFHLAGIWFTGGGLPWVSARRGVWATFRVDPARREGDWFDELLDRGVINSILLSGDADAALRYVASKKAGHADRAWALRGLRAAYPAAQAARARSLAADQAECRRSFGTLLASLPDVERVEPDGALGEQLWGGTLVESAFTMLDRTGGEAAEVLSLGVKRLDPPGSQPERSYVDAWLGGLVDRLGPSDTYAVALGPGLGGWQRIAVREPRRWLFDLWGATLPYNAERPPSATSPPKQVDHLSVLSADGGRALLIDFDWNGVRLKARLRPTATLLNRAESKDRLEAAIARSDGVHALSRCEQGQRPPDELEATPLPSLAADAPRAERRRWFKAGLDALVRAASAFESAPPAHVARRHYDLSTGELWPYLWTSVETHDDGDWVDALWGAGALDLLRVMVPEGSCGLELRRVGLGYSARLVR